MSLSALAEKAKFFFSSHAKAIKTGVTILWVILLGLLLWGLWESRAQLIPYLSVITWDVLAKITGFYFLALLFSVFGWALISNVFSHRISLSKHFNIFLATMAARRLPGTIWYVSGRAVFYKNLGVSQLKTASASGMELIISFLANCILAIIALPFGFIHVKGVTYPLLAVGIVISFLMVNPTTIGRFMGLIKQPLTQPIKYWQPLLWLLMRFIVILAGSMMVFQIVNIFQPVGREVFWVVLSARALAGAASFITFFLPSSFGASDITLATVLSTLMPITLAGLTALAVRVITTLLDIILGLVFYFLAQRK